MKITAVDMLGQPIQEGDFLAYGLREGNGGAMRLLRVVKVETNRRPTPRRSIGIGSSKIWWNEASLACEVIRTDWKGDFSKPYAWTFSDSHWVNDESKTDCRMDRVIVLGYDGDYGSFFE